MYPITMLFFDPDTGVAAIGEATNSAEALLFGRRTGQAMTGACPERVGDPFAEQMNSGAGYVASTSLTSDDMTLWENPTLLPSDEVAGAVDALRAADGGNIQVWAVHSLSGTSSARISLTSIGS
jgi:hypothetical protein